MVPEYQRQVTYAMLSVIVGDWRYADKVLGEMDANDLLRLAGEAKELSRRVAQELADRGVKAEVPSGE